MKRLGTGWWENLDEKLAALNERERTKRTILKGEKEGPVGGKACQRKRAGILSGALKCYDAHDR